MNGRFLEGRVAVVTGGNRGIGRATYAVVNRVADIIPVDFNIPGDPPSPRQILVSLLTLFHDLERQEDR